MPTKQHGSDGTSVPQSPSATPDGASRALDGTDNRRRPLDDILEAPPSTIKHLIQFAGDNKAQIKFLKALLAAAKDKQTQLDTDLAHARRLQEEELRSHGITYEWRIHDRAARRFAQSGPHVRAMQQQQPKPSRNARQGSGVPTQYEVPVTMRSDVYDRDGRLRPPNPIATAATRRIGTVTFSFSKLVAVWDHVHPEAPLDRQKARRAVERRGPMLSARALEALFDAIRPAAGRHKEGSPEQEIANANLRKRFYAAGNRGLAHMRLIRLLGQPLREILPAAPELTRDPEPVDPVGEGPRSFGDYLAVAIETGDSAALSAVDKRFRMVTRKGPKEANWPHILDVYRATHSQLCPLHQALKDDRVAWARKQRATAVGRRLVAAGLFDGWLANDPSLLMGLPARSARNTRVHLDEITALLVATESGVSPNTLLQRANAKATRVTASTNK